MITSFKTIVPCLTPGKLHHLKKNHFLKVSINASHSLADVPRSVIFDWYTRGVLARRHASNSIVVQYKIIIIIIYIKQNNVELKTLHMLLLPYIGCTHSGHVYFRLQRILRNTSKNGEEVNVYCVFWEKIESDYCEIIFQKKICGT